MDSANDILQLLLFALLNLYFEVHQHALNTVGTWLRQRMILAVWLLRLLGVAGAGASPTPRVEPLNDRRACVMLTSDGVDHSHDGEREEGEEVDEDEVRRVRRATVG